MPVAYQSRDLARPQARIPVRVTKKVHLRWAFIFCNLWIDSRGSVVSLTKNRFTLLCKW